MAIPDYQSCMLPLLTYCSDGKEHHIRESREHIAKLFQLTEEDKRQVLPSGKQSVLDNRVGWAKTYLAKAGILEATRRGHFQITPRGLNVLRENPPHIDNAFLGQFPEFLGFKGRQPIETPMPDKEMTPEETLEDAYQNLRQKLAQELLDQIRSCSPYFFEKLVVALLVKMGYGGSIQDAGKAIGRSKDEGIDGIIKEDRLGLDTIYIQAKRWENTVGRPEIQKFAGALQGQRAKKGVFMTTSNFSTRHVRVFPLREVLLHHLIAAMQVFHIFPAIEPDDVGEEFDLLRVEIAMRPVDLSVGVSCVDEQHPVRPLGALLALVQKPQRAGQRHRVEKVRADGNHHLHRLVLDKLLPDLQLRGPGVARGIGHDETGPAFAIESTVEQLYPQIIGIVYLGHPEGIAIGLCKVATIGEIEEQGWSLNPGRYVGVAEQEEDDYDFPQRLQKLNEELETLNAEARELEARIAENVGKILER